MPVQDVGGGTMMGKANAVPYEDQAGMSEVQRKRLLMQQLLKESLSGGSGVVPDSGAIKVPDYAGAIGKVLQAYIGVKGAESGAKEAADVAAKVDEEHRSALDRYSANLQDRPLGGYQFGGQQMAGPPARTNEITGMSKGDMVAALTQAARERDPTMRAFGMKGMEKENEAVISGTLRPKDYMTALPNMRMDSPAIAANLPGVIPKPPQVQEGPVLGTVTGYDPSGAPQLARTPIEQFGPPTEATPSMPAYIKELTSDKTIPIGQGQLRSEAVASAAVEIGREGVKDLVKRVSESYSKVQPAAGQVGYLVDAVQILDKAEAYTGKPWSTLELPIQKGLAALGIKPDANGNIPSTEMIAPILGISAFNIMDKLRPASDPDRKVAFDLVGAGQNIDPRTAKTLAKMAISATMNDYENHVKSINAFSEYENMTDEQGRQPFKNVIPPLRNQYQVSPLKFNVDPNTLGISSGGFPGTNKVDVQQSIQTKKTPPLDLDKYKVQ